MLQAQEEFGLDVTCLFAKVPPHDQTPVNRNTILFVSIQEALQTAARGKCIRKPLNDGNPLWPFLMRSQSPQCSSVVVDHHGACIQRLKLRSTTTRGVLFLRRTSRWANFWPTGRTIRPSTPLLQEHISMFNSPAGDSRPYRRRPENIPSLWETFWTLLVI